MKNRRKGDRDRGSKAEIRNWMTRSKKSQHNFTGCRAFLLGKMTNFHEEPVMFLGRTLSTHPTVLFLFVASSLPFLPSYLSS
jgi:hypothetical protein